MRRLVRQMVADLKLPDPFDVELLCDRLGDRVGRPVKLMRYPIPWDVRCHGLYIRGQVIDGVAVDIIVVDSAAPHQNHIILHEAGHGLLGLDEGTARSPVLDAGVMRAIAPEVDADAIRRLRCRSRYTDREELLVENFATVAGLKISQQRTSSAMWVPPDESGVALRLSQMFDALGGHA